MKRAIAYTVIALFSLALQAESIRVLYIGDSVTDGGWGNSAGHSVHLTNVTNGTRIISSDIVI